MKRKLYHLAVLISLHFFSHAQPCTIPTSFFPDDTIVVCSGSSYTLTAPTISGDYLWSTTQTANPVSINADGKYWLEINDGACRVSDTIVVLFNSFLLSPKITDLKLCKGQSARPLPVTGQNLLWYKDPLGGTGSTVLPVPSTADTGRMTYWFSQTIRGCESPRLPMLVKVIDKPKFELGDPFIIPCNTLGIVLQVVADGESEYTWSNGSNDISMIAEKRGQYSLYAQNMCGNYRDTAVAVECEDKCVQFPTAFTPNGDGKNDLYQAATFCPVPKYKLVIYNRNGELVYKTSDPKSGWNGYYNGKLQPNGAYIYYTEFFDFVLKNDFTEKGTFVLMK
ncbi:MAG: gliding motility-associated C-terminal domain-containing protein [Chitinophagaceae bacterium]